MAHIALNMTCHPSYGVSHGSILWLYRDHGKENENYYIRIGYMLGLYRDNEKENGNFYIGMEYILVFQ